MSDSTEQRSLNASIVALVVAVAGVAMFLPPWVERTVSSPLRTVATALVLAVALLLHWVYLGQAAQRRGRSPLGWVAMSLLLFPVGSAAALILMADFDAEARKPQTAA
jgi:quinol-cytochrome oxidoreductase complex cytochrome b subunit